MPLKIRKRKKGRGKKNGPNVFSCFPACGGMAIKEGKRDALPPSQERGKERSLLAFNVKCHA